MTTIQELLAKRGGSYDLSAKLRAWHDANVQPRRRYTRLAREYPLDESIVIDWSLPRDRRRHRDVPAKRIPRLAELLGATVEALLDGVPVQDVWQLPSDNYRQYCRVCGRVRISHEPIADECCSVRVQAPAPPPTTIAPVRPSVRTFDVFCLLCARGLGRGGVRCFVHQLPRQRRCVTCGGVMLAEDLSGGTRLREERATLSHRLLDDAALDRAAR